MNSYLCETEYIDFTHPLIAEKVKELRGKSNNSLDYINQTYLFVRDEITHTWDARGNKENVQAEFSIDQERLPLLLRGRNR